MATWETWSAPDRRALLSRTPVAVLMGGTSDERGVSLVSGAAVSASLRDLTGPSYDVTPPIFDVEIDARGRWVLDGAPLEPHQAIASLPDDTVFLLALHGGEGEDGTVQRLLRDRGRRHTGEGPDASALCMDKHRSREAAAGAGVAVAPGAFVSAEDFRADRAAALATLSGAAAWPCFLKHSAAGSSVGVHRCATAEQLAVAADAVVELGGDLLVEAEVVGLETTVGVMGPGEDAATLPVAEVIPAPGAFFDHEQKYSDESGAEEYCPPRYLPNALVRRLEQRARSAWGAFGGEVYGRIDFIVPGTRGEDGGYRFDDGAEPVLLEANTLPGFTPRSLLPLAASVEGVGFRELCLELVARAL